MPRSIRIEYPGAFYHVMARGNRREAIFRDDADRRFFLQTLGEACAMTGWRIHAWVLLSNHYHLFVETPEANLSKGMQWLQNTLTRRFNTRHRLWGRLFGDRYKAVSVEGRVGYYYETLMDYIHLNPARCGLVRPQRKQSLLDYPWSSLAQGYALPGGKRPSWLAAKDGLAAFGYADTAKGRRRWVERLDRRMVEEGTVRCGQVPLGAEVDARCSHVAAWMVLGKSGLCGETAPAWADHAPSRPTPRIPGQPGKESAQCCAGGGIAAGRTAGGTTRARGSATVAGFRRAKGGDRANHLANDNGLAELVGRTAGYGKCSQREPTIAAAGCRCAAGETAILSAKMGAIGQ